MINLLKCGYSVHVKVWRIMFYYLFVYTLNERAFSTQLRIFFPHETDENYINLHEILFSTLI